MRPSPAFPAASSFVLWTTAALVLSACGAPPAPTTPEPGPPAASSLAAAPATTPSPAPPPADPPPPPAAISTTPPATPPPPTAPSGVLALTQGKIPDAARDLAVADEKVRKCLAQAKTPAKAGSLAVKLTIATSGFTLNADVKPSGDVGKDVAACAKTALRDQQWGKPEGGGVAAVAGTFAVP